MTLNSFIKFTYITNVFYMNYIIHFFLFIVIFILYINFHKQNNYNDISQIYELEYVNNHSLQSSCDVNQPAIFEYYIEPIQESNTLLFHNSDSSDISVEYKDLSAFLKSKTTPVISTQNFIDTNNDSHNAIQPPLSYFVGHNIICGSRNAVSKSFIHNYYRKFLYVSEGSIEVNILSYNHTPNNAMKNDFVNYEFSIDQNISNIGKKCVIEKGNVIFIPPNCVYSIEFLDSSNICIDFSFHSLISILSNIHKQVIYFMQQSNISKTPSELKNYKIKNNVEVVKNDVEVIKNNVIENALPPDQVEQSTEGLS